MRLRPGTLRGTALISVAVFVATVAALVHVWIRLQVIEVGYALARERKVLHELSQQNQRLRLELGTRSDPAVIERRAREELHMTPPDPRAIRLLTVGKSSEIAVAPGPRRANP